MGEERLLRRTYPCWCHSTDLAHLEALLEMAEQENVDNRPKCVWPVKSPVKDARGKKIGTNPPAPCGSEKDVFKVSGKGKYTGRPRQSDICRKHLPDAIREWQYESAVPISDVGRKKWLEAGFIELMKG